MEPEGAGRRRRLAGQPDLQLRAGPQDALVSDLARKLLNSLRTEARVLEDREQAAVLWAQLKKYGSVHRPVIVARTSTFRSWALCELICEQSVKAAGDNADRAVELAELALKVAGLTPGDDAWRSRLRGYAWAHVGNARRVRGNLPQAEEAFARLDSTGAGAGVGHARRIRGELEKAQRQKART